MLKRSIFRTIKRSHGRYLAILAIIALGVGFFAGLRITEQSMHATADQYLNELRLYDFRLVSTLGLTDDDVEAFRTLDGIENAYGSVSADLIVEREDGSDAVLHAHTLLDGINGIDLLAGRLPQNDTECVLDSRYAGEEMIGKTLSLSANNSEETFDLFTHDTYTIVGIANASEYINFQRGTTALSGGVVSGYVYFMPQGFTTDYYTELYLSLPGTHEIYSEEYTAAVDAIRPSVEVLLENRADLRIDGIYNEAKGEIDDAKATLAEKKAELADGQKEINDGWTSYYSEKEAVETQLADTKLQLDSIRTELDRGWTALETAKQDPSAALPQVQEQLRLQETALNQAEAEYEAGFAAYEQGLVDARAEFAAVEKELTEGQAEIDNAKPEIETAEREISDAETELASLERPIVYVFDRSTNFGYASFESDIKIVSGVARVFPIFFFLVAALVCITTMTRMVGEQRTQNGVLKALGYKKFAIASQYLVYAGSASVIGCVVGFLLGSKFMPLVLWEVYQIMYTIDRPAVFVLDWALFFLCTVLYLACMLGVTYFVCRRDLKQCAAGLMRPIAPSAGKRVFLERIGFIWKPMKFLHKVSIRNILRYKKRMVMMIIGIGGCMALLLTGFGIRDTIQPIVDYQYGEISLYDATVTFLQEPTETDMAEFASEIQPFTENSVLVHSGSADAVLNGDTTPVSLISYRDDMSPFVDLHAGETALSWPSQGEAVINYRLADAYGVCVGDTIELRDSDYHSMSVTVSGIYDNYLYDIVYIHADTFAEGFGYEPEINTAYLDFFPEEDDHQAAATLLSSDLVAAVSLTVDAKESVANMLQSLDYIVLIVLFCAGALAFIVLYNLTNITITERSREIATLKVLGFHNKEQNSYVFRENMILSLIGALCGIPFGIALLHYIMGQIQIDNFYFGCRLAWSSYLWAFLLTMLFTMIVDLALSAKLRRINMAEAMKSIE